jgi:serine/threonine-protein kinase ATR
LNKKLTGLLEELDARLNYSQVSWSNLDPILRLRRGMFGAALSKYSTSNVKFSEQLKCEIGECWLKSARIARKAGQLQESYSYLLEAEKYHNPKLFIESAELKWKRGKHTDAIFTLKKGLKETFPDVIQALEDDPTNVHTALLELDNQSVGLRDLCSQGKLLLARYVEGAASVGQEGIRKHFDHAKEIVKNSDEIFYYMAKFMDKKSMKMTPDQIINQSEIVTYAAMTYMRSMRFGPSFLDECMPRLLTIWLDFAATIQEAVTSKNKESFQIIDHASKQLTKLNKTIATTRLKMPTYYLLTSFPQIVSRICHPNNETYLVLKSLMVQVFLDYPQQAAWHMVSVSKNSNTTRKAR